MSTQIVGEKASRRPALPPPAKPEQRRASGGARAALRREAALASARCAWPASTTDGRRNCGTLESVTAAVGHGGRARRRVVTANRQARGVHGEIKEKLAAGHGTGS